MSSYKILLKKIIILNNTPKRGLLFFQNRLNNKWHPCALLLHQYIFLRFFLKQRTLSITSTFWIDFKSIPQVYGIFYSKGFQQTCQQCHSCWKTVEYLKDYFPPHEDQSEIDIFNSMCQWSRWDANWEWEFQLEDANRYSFLRVSTEIQLLCSQHMHLHTCGSQTL